MTHRRHALLASGLGLLLALPAAADITVIGHYTFANGDTLTRWSYYTSRAVRTTLPNGNEIIFRQSTNRITLIDHAGKRYWEGSRGKADSILARMRAETAKAMRDSLTPERQAQWTEIYSALTDSVHLESTGRTRTIAGYPVGEWVLTAGPYLRQERWVARSLSMPDFSREVQGVAIASIMDPLGRGLMKLVIQARATTGPAEAGKEAHGVDGLTLAGRLRFKTLGQQGEMSWEALKVVSGPIPESAWLPPQSYERWTPPKATSP